MQVKQDEADPGMVCVGLTLHLLQGGQQDCWESCVYFVISAVPPCFFWDDALTKGSTWYSPNHSEDLELCCCG